MESVTQHCYVKTRQRLEEPSLEVAQTTLETSSMTLNFDL